LHGNTRLHVELRPEQLGGIDMDLSRTPEGLHIAITTEHAQTGQMLEEQLANLRQSLSQNGIQLAQLDIRQQSAGHGWHAPHQPETWTNGQPHAKDAPIEEIAPVPVERESAVDYRV
jgi:flagellar hook-length control protein FliK